MIEVVFTGVFKLKGEHIARDLLIEMAQEQGLYVAKQVTHHTDFLVVGDTGPHGLTLKMKKALDDYGGHINIVSPEKFMEMV